MSLSVGGAIKAMLETKGLGIPFYKDVAPQKSPKVYGVIHEGIGLAMDPFEDGGPAQGTTNTGKELMQLDLWQNWLKADGTVAEDPLLPDRLTNAIHGARCLATPAASVSPKLVYVIRQEGRVRIFDRDSKTVHHAYTLAVHRQI